MSQERDYDAMFRESQLSKFPKENASQEKRFDEQFRESYQKRSEPKAPVTPEILGNNRRSRSCFGVFGNVCAFYNVA